MYEWIGKLTANDKKLKRWAKICGWLPENIILALCRGLGLMLYLFGGKQIKNKVLCNMRDLLPEQSAAELQQAGLLFFQNAVIVLYEILIESTRLQDSQNWRFEAEGEAYLEEVLSAGRGAIVYSPHMGNFFYYYWYLCQKYSCLTVATGGSSELLPLYMKFSDLGCPGLDYDNTPPLELLRKMKKHLQAGGVVFLLGDFWRPTFPKSRFFGRPTRTPEGASSLSIDLRVPVIPCYGWRERGFVHRIRFEAPMHLYAAYPKRERSAATLMLNRFMEQVIREHPAEWFYWFNADQRWEKEPDMSFEEAGSQKHRSLDVLVSND